MTSFNIMERPCFLVEKAGAVQELSGREVLTQAHNLGQLQARSPLETVAMLRFLLAVAHRACGPKSLRDSIALLKAGRFPPELDAYLDTWLPKFDLFDDEFPLLQIPKMEMAVKSTLAAITMELAAKNNTTLFDHNYDAKPPAFTPAEAFRILLAAQQFARGGGVGATASVDGVEIIRPNFTHGSCLRGITIWLTGRSLFETLVLNMLPGESSDYAPLWERVQQLDLLDKGKGETNITVPANGAIDRYVWQSRMIRLLPEQANGNGFVRFAFVTQGRSADASMGDPMKVFLFDKDKAPYAMNLNGNKASWRDLHSLISFSKKVSTSTILNHASKLVSYGTVGQEIIYRLNVVGFAKDEKSKKPSDPFVLWRHDRMALPKDLLREVGEDEETLTDRLGLALSDAEFAAREIRGRVWSVSKQFVPPHGNPDPKDVSALADKLDPTEAYWARLETYFYAFLDMLPKDMNRAFAQWRAALKSEAERALRESCNQLGHTPSALRATAHISFYIDPDQSAVQERRDEKKKTRAAKLASERKVTA